ncbi:MAG TPA: transketolase C-terminal domain-containing protein, partial [Nitrospirota bacterium]
LSLAGSARRIMTVEESLLAGGFGSAVVELLMDAGVDGVPVRRVGVPDTYVLQGTQAQIRKRLGLDEHGIEEAVLDFIGAHAPHATVSENR